MKNFKSITEKYQPPKPVVQQTATATATGSVNSSSNSSYSEPSYDYLFKIRLVGDSGIGKSCLLLRFTDDTYTESYISTIGMDFKIRTIEVDNKTVRLQIIDTAGQERFRTVESNYLRGGHACILMFDLTELVSFWNIKQHIQDVERYMPDSAQLFLVGTKSDLVTKRVVDHDTAAEFANNNNMPYIETSAKRGTNVEAVFVELATILVNAMKPTVAKQGLFSNKPSQEQVSTQPSASRGCVIC